MLELPTAFQSQMQTRLGTSYSEFESALNTPPLTSIRINPLKLPHQQEHLTPLPWTDSGYLLPQRPVFTLDPLFHAGGYYVQEANSMFLEWAYRQLFPENPPISALDLCAAPGGKSTHLQSLIHPLSLLVSNEVIKVRASILRDNLIRWGAPNVSVTRLDPGYFAQYKAAFDLIVIDAPCSGEGLFRKDPDAIGHWSPEHVGHCAERQKRIVSDVLPALKSGGYIFYSTCTYNAPENEELLAWLATQYDLEVIDLNPPSDWQITLQNGSHQFYPHLTPGEGFSFGVLRKKGTTEPSQTQNTKPKKQKKSKRPSKKIISDPGPLKAWLAQPESYHFFERQEDWYFNAPFAPEQQALFEQIPSIYKGINLGQNKKKNSVPAPALAYFPGISKGIPSLDLTQADAQAFMKKEWATVPEQTGWHLVRYQGLGLGWVKAMPGRINNYFPTNWRIRMPLAEQNNIVKPHKDAL